MKVIDAARSAYCAPAAAVLMVAPSPCAARTSPRTLMYSETIAACPAPPAASAGKSACSAARLMRAPSPGAVISSPWKETYSATMLAFHAPPAAVTQPVTRYENTAGT